MDFTEICSILGGSPFSEEYRGDIQAAEVALQQYGPVDEADLPEEQALRALRNSLLSIAKGNYTDATAALKPLIETVGLDPIWKYRCEIYTMLITSLRVYTPLLRNLPGDIAMERTARLGFHGPSRNYRKVDADYRQIMGEEEPNRFECLPLIGVISCQVYMRSSMMRHPQYPTPSSNETVEMTTKRIQTIDSFRQFAIQQNLGALERYFRRIQVELFYIAGLPERIESMQGLQAAYVEAGDWAGLATCKLFVADHIVASPFSTPIALNLFPIHSKSAGYENMIWDPVEDGLTFQASADAMQLLQEADMLYERALSTRGRGAICLRRGCLMHMKCYSTACDSSEQKQKCLNEADSYFEKAASFFTGDEMHLQIIEGHRILVKISQQKYDHLRERAAEIGSWGKKASNEGISEFVGLLLIRFGRRLLLNHGSIDMALVSFESARACFDALGQQHGAFKAMVSYLQVYESTFNHSVARALIDVQQKSFLDLIELFDELAKIDRIFFGFIGLSYNIITTYDQTVSLIFLGVGDHHALEEWRALVKSLLKKHDFRSQMWQVFADRFHRTFFLGDHVRTSPSLLGAPTWGEASAAISGVVCGWWQKAIMWITGGRNPTEPKGELENMIPRLEDEEWSTRILDSYGDMTYRAGEAFLVSDIDLAEKQMKEFLDDLDGYPDGLAKHFVFVMIIRNMGGDMAQARKYLSTISDAELLGQ